MSKYREIRGSLQGERCEHKSWADLCEKCEIDRLRSENERLRAALVQIVKPGGADGFWECFEIARSALKEK